MSDFSVLIDQARAVLREYRDDATLCPPAVWAGKLSSALGGLLEALDAREGDTAGYRELLDKLANERNPA